jgi:hypothetical protein
MLISNIYFYFHKILGPNLTVRGSTSLSDWILKNLVKEWNSKSELLFLVILQYSRKNVNIDFSNVLICTRNYYILEGKLTELTSYQRKW